MWACARSALMATNIFCKTASPRHTHASTSPTGQASLDTALPPGASALLVTAQMPATRSSVGTAGSGTGVMDPAGHVWLRLLCQHVGPGLRLSAQEATPMLCAPGSPTFKINLFERQRVRDLSSLAQSQMAANS